MSALPPIADMDHQGCDVRFVQKADVRAAGKMTGATHDDARLVSLGVADKWTLR